MSPEQESDLLDRVGEIIRALSVESRARLAELLASGMAPHKAVMQVAGDFSQAWATELALGMSALHAAEIPLSAVLAMPVSGVKLSRHMHANSRETAATVDALVKQHMAAMKDARKLALELYEGYGFREQEALKVAYKKAMPRYLLDALRSDPAWNRAVLMADGLKTPALKAAYMQALEAVGTKKMERLLDVAYQEKMRYYAKRIAVTELHREWDMIQETEYLADDGLEYVQWRMSQTHEKSDICDLYAKQDKHGLGPGCYPKALAPRAPAHPFCRCKKSARLDLTGAKVRHKPGADSAYLRSLPVDEAARVAGSREKLKAIYSGKETPAEDYERALLRARKADNGGMENVRPYLSSAERSEFYRHAIANRHHDEKKPIAKFTNQDSLSSALGKNAVNVDEIVLQASYIGHIHDNHASGGLRKDKYPVTESDLSFIESIINGDKAPENKGRTTHTGNPLIKFSQTIDGIEYKVIGEVREGKKNRNIAVYNFYKR